MKRLAGEGKTIDIRSELNYLGLLGVLLAVVFGSMFLAALLQESAHLSPALSLTVAFVLLGGSAMLALMLSHRGRRGVRGRSLRPPQRPPAIVAPWLVILAQAAMALGSARAEVPVFLETHRFGVLQSTLTIALSVAFMSMLEIRTVRKRAPTAAR